MPGAQRVAESQGQQSSLQKGPFQITGSEIAITFKGQEPTFHEIPNKNAQYCQVRQFQKISAIFKYPIQYLPGTLDINSHILKQYGNYGYQGPRWVASHIMQAITI